MPEVTYLVGSGESRVVTAAPGESVMSAAVRHGVPGILGECGGNSSCATCHVWVGHQFLPRLGPVGEMEEDLLDLAVDDRREGSRLACQIAISDDLDGLVVEVPSSLAPGMAPPRLDLR